MMKTLVDREDLVSSPPELGCVLSLTGLPGGGNKIYDRSPYGNVGTITGATWKRLPSGLWYLYFDGNDDNVLVPDSAVFRNITDVITLEFWLRQVSGNGGSMFGGGDPDVASGFVFNRGNPGTNIEFLVRLGAFWRSSGLVDILSTTAFTHIVGVYDGITVAIYSNGALTNSASFSGSIKQDNECQVVLGANKGQSSNTNIEIALPRVIRRVLSPFEIQKHFDREKYLFGVW